MTQSIGTDISRTWRPRYFDLAELVPPETLRYLGNRAWELLDVRILWTADALRRYFGAPITINDPTTGLTLRGWRPDGCPTGASHSQHRYGRALDMTIRGVTAGEAREMIRTAPQDAAMRHITAVELDVLWLHVDCRFTGLPKILWFSA